MHEVHFGSHDDSVTVFYHESSYSSGARTAQCHLMYFTHFAKGRSLISGKQELQLYHAYLINICLTKLNMSVNFYEYISYSLLVMAKPWSLPDKKIINPESEL